MCGIFLPASITSSQLHALQLLDMDGDGLKDLITGKRWWAHGPKGDDEPMAPAVLYWFKLVRKNGKAHFVPNKIDNDSGVGTQLVVGDVNGDKKPDVVVGNKKGVYLFTNEVSVNTSMAYNFEKTDKEEEGFVKIFDGSSFNGWEGDKNWFRIENGAIVAGKTTEKIPHNFFLATEKDYYNFELRLQVKMDHSINNNGGLCIICNTWFETDFFADFNNLGLIVNRLYSLMDNNLLVALPMFIFMGIMLEKSGIAESLMESFQKIFKNFRGGLAIAVTLIGLLLAASTGIVGASVVLLSVMALPTMLKSGYSKELSCGTICSAGCLGILIPPKNYGEFRTALYCLKEESFNADGEIPNGSAHLISKIS